MYIYINIKGSCGTYSGLQRSARRLNYREHRGQALRYQIRRFYAFFRSNMRGGAEGYLARTPTYCETFTVDVMSWHRLHTGIIKIDKASMKRDMRR